MTEALELCDEILHYEPNNYMILEYKASLTQYIAEGDMCILILKMLWY
jgi:hypothetical protein